MIINVNGKITDVLPRKEGISKTGNAFVSQDFVITEECENPSTLCFNVFGEEKLQQYNIKVGMSVSVSLVVESRVWNGKYFTSLKCIKCFSEKAAMKSPQTIKPLPQEPIAPIAQPAKPVATNNVDVDDLPF